MAAASSPREAVVGEPRSPGPSSARRWSMARATARCSRSFGSPGSAWPRYSATAPRSCPRSMSPIWRTALAHRRHRARDRRGPTTLSSPGRSPAPDSCGRLRPLGSPGRRIPVPAGSAGWHRTGGVARVAGQHHDPHPRQGQRVLSARVDRRPGPLVRDTGWAPRTTSRAVSRRPGMVPVRGMDLAEARTQPADACPAPVVQPAPGDLLLA